MATGIRTRGTLRKGIRTRATRHRRERTRRPQGRTLPLLELTLHSMATLNLVATHHTVAIPLQVTQAHVRRTRVCIAVQFYAWVLYIAIPIVVQQVLQRFVLTLGNSRLSLIAAVPSFCCAMSTLIYDDAPQRVRLQF